MPSSSKIIVVGGGIFGTTAALSLRERGHEVHLFEAGKIPNPQASSTDISKMIRADYGADTFYTDMMLEAFKGWDQWNERWERDLYHQVGFLLLTHEAMQPGSLEYESIKAFEERNIPVERISPALLRERYPQWHADQFADGYYNPLGGWAESGAVVKQLAQTALEKGVTLHEETAIMSLLANGDSVGGIFTKEGQVYGADQVVVAAGVWSGQLIPELEDKMVISGQPIYLFKPKDGKAYDGRRFPGWAADITRTGWYGFPANKNGLVKIANHGEGVVADPDAENDIPPHYYPALNTFLAHHLPKLEQARIESARLCYYCDTWDSDFYICPHPVKKGLTIAFGGSGHGFKFAPLLGDLIADVVEGKPNKYAHRFQWREKGTPKLEAARKRN